MRNDSLSFSDLFSKSRKGDEEAKEALVLLIVELNLRSICEWYYGVKVAQGQWLNFEVDDLYQESLLALQIHIDELNNLKYGEDSFRRWYRKTTKRILWSLQNQQRKLSYCPIDYADGLADQNSNNYTLEKEVLDKQIRDFVLGLGLMGEVWIAREYYGCGFQNIADYFKISTSEVSRMLARVTKAVNKLLKPKPCTQ